MINLKKLFSFGKKPSHDKLRIAFHTDEVDYGTHGYLIASCRQRGLNAPVAVRFVFVGMSVPPALTEAIVKHLFDQARNQGFVPQSIKAYGMKVVKPHTRDLNQVLSEDRKMAECGTYRPSALYGTPPISDEAPAAFVSTTTKQESHYA